MENFVRRSLALAAIVLVAAAAAFSLNGLAAAEPSLSITITTADLAPADEALLAIPAAFPSIPIVAQLDTLFNDNKTLLGAVAGNQVRRLQLPASITDFDDITIELAVDDIVFDDDSRSIGFPGTFTLNGADVDLLLLVQWFDDDSAVPNVSIGLSAPNIDLADLGSAWTLPAGPPPLEFPETWVALATGEQDISKFAAPAVLGDPGTLLGFYPSDFAIEGLGIDYQSTLVLDSAVGPTATAALGYTPSGTPVEATTATLRGDIALTGAIFNGDFAGTDLSLSATLPPAPGTVLGGWLQASDDWSVTVDYTVDDPPAPIEVGITGQLSPTGVATGEFEAFDVVGSVTYSGGDVEAALAGTLVDDACIFPTVAPYAAGATACWRDALGNDWLDLSEVQMGVTFTLVDSVADAQITMDALLDVDGAPAAGATNIEPFDLDALFTFADGTPSTITADFTVSGSLSLEEVAGLYLSQGTAAGFPGQETLELTQVAFSASTRLGEEAAFSLTASANVLDTVEAGVLIGLTNVFQDGADRQLLVLGVKTSGVSLSTLFEKTTPGLAGSVTGELDMGGVDYTIVFPLDPVSAPPYDIAPEDLGQAAIDFYDRGATALRVRGDITVQGTADLNDLGTEFTQTFGLVPDATGAVPLPYTGAASGTFDWGTGDGAAFDLTDLSLTATLPNGAKLAAPDWLQRQIDRELELPGAELENVFAYFGYDGTDYDAEIRTSLVADIDNSGTTENVAVTAALTYVAPDGADPESYTFSVRGDIGRSFDASGELVGPATWVDPFSVDITVSDPSILFEYTNTPTFTAEATITGTVPVADAQLQVTGSVAIEGEDLSADLRVELIGRLVSEPQTVDARPLSLRLVDLLDLGDALYGPMGGVDLGPLDLENVEVEELIFGPATLVLHTGADPTFLLTGTTEYEGVAADGLLSIDLTPAGELELLTAIRLRPTTEMTLGQLDDYFPAPFTDVYIPPIDDFVLPDVTLVITNTAVDKPSTLLDPAAFEYFKPIYACAPASTQADCEFVNKFDAGVTAIASAPLPASIAAFKDQLSINDNPVIVKGFVPMFGSNAPPSLEAILPPVIPPPAATDAGYWLREIGLSFKITPTAFSLDGRAKVKFGGDDLVFVVSGAVDTTAKSVTFTGSLTGDWVSPFDLEWLTVRGLAIELGVDPVNLKVGLFGAFNVGSRDFSGSILVDIPASGTPILKGIRGASASGVSSSDLVAFQAAVAGAGAAEFDTSALPSFSLKNVEFSYSTVDNPTLCLKQGIILKGDLYVNPVAGAGNAGPISLTGPCESVPDRPDPSQFCIDRRAEGCFATVQAKVTETNLGAAGSLGRFVIGDPEVLVWDDAAVDLRVTSFAQQLSLSGAARIPGFLQGQVQLDITAFGRAFQGDFEIYDVFFAKVDGTITAINPSAPFNLDEAGFFIHGEMRSGFAAAAAAQAEPLLAEVRRVFSVVKPLYDDIVALSTTNDPVAVLAGFPNRLQSVGVDTPAIVTDIAGAVADFNASLSVATAPFDAYNAVAAEIPFLEPITVPSLAVNPAGLVDLALNGYQLPAAFSFPGAEIPFLPKTCNGGLGTFIGNTCYSTPPLPAVFATVCAPWPFDDECARVQITPAIPGVIGVELGPICAGVVQNGKCYAAGLVPIPAPSIPGLCSTPGIAAAPGSPECSVSGLINAALENPLRLVLGESLDIPGGQIPSLPDALNRLSAAFQDGTLFEVNCATFDAQVGVLQADRIVDIGLSATMLGKQYGFDSLSWNFDSPADSAFGLAKKIITTVLTGTLPTGPPCTSIGTAPTPPPTNLALGGSTATVENGLATVSGTFTSDTTAAHRLEIAWRDGSIDNVTLPAGTQSFSRSHRYLDDGVSGTTSDLYYVTVKVTNPATGSVGATRVLRVDNAVPVVSTNLVASVVEDGSVVLTGSIADPGTLDTYTVRIDWRDGTPATQLSLGTRRTFSASHRYLDDNPSGTPSDVVPIAVTVTDDDLGTETATRDLTVVNAAPADLTVAVERSTQNADGTFTALAPDATSINEGDWATLRGSFTDVGTNDRHTVTIEWNDGGAVIVEDGAGVLCEQARPGCPSVANTGTSTTLLLEQGVRDFMVRHRFDDDNPTATPSDLYAVSVTVTDDDTGSTSTSRNIRVDNVAPSEVVLAFGLLAIDENSDVVLSGSFVDPGLLDTHALVVDWGDDSTPDAMTLSAPGVSDDVVRQFTLQHRYLDDNPTATPVDDYVLTISLVDDDGGIAQPGRTLFKAPVFDPETGEPLLDINGEIVTTDEEADQPIVTVADVPAEVEISITPQIDENDVAVLTGSFYDPGTLDGWTLDIDWGDDSSNDIVVIADGLDEPLEPAGSLLSASFEDVLEDGVVIGRTWSFELDHQYLDDDPTNTATDTYTVTATVTDDDTLVGDATAEIIVDNVLPTLDAGSDQFVFEDDLVSLDPAAWADIGTVDTHTARISWGDGTLVDEIDVTEFAGPVGVPTGAVGTLDATHTYRRPGIYEATICIADDDQPTTPVCDTFEVTVVNSFLKFGVFGEDKYVRIDRDSVIDGGVGGNDEVRIDNDTAVQGDVVSVHDDIELDDRSSVVGNLIAGDEIDIDRDASVAGNADAGTSVHVDRKATVSGTIVEGPAAAAFADVTWLDLDVRAGDRNVGIRGGSLAPGTYRDVRADRNSLALQAGVYQVRNLRVGDGVELLIDLDPDGDGIADPLIIEAERAVDMKRGVSMTIVSDVGDVTDILVLAGNGKISLGSNGSYIGTFISDDHDAKLGKDATLVGGLFGRSAKVDDRAFVSAQPALRRFADHLVERRIGDDVVLLTVEAGPDQTTYEDVTVTLDAASFFNGLGNTNTATIDWGDGRTAVGRVDNTTGSISGTHVYSEPGVYVVTVCVFEPGTDAPCQLDTIEVTVLNGFLDRPVYEQYPSRRGRVPSTIRWVDFDIEGGRADLTVRGSQTALPGIYDDVRIQGGTLSLVAGVYRMESLKADSYTSIDIDLDPDGDGVAEPLVLEVEREFTAGRNVEMRITSSVGDASDILILVAESKVELGDNGSFVGTFIAADNRASLGRRASLTGALYGERVSLGHDASVSFAPAITPFVDQLLRS